MDGFHLSDPEIAIILKALDALELFIGGRPEYMIERIRNLGIRFANHCTGFTVGEIRNVCMGIELLLDVNPMDYKASQLLSKLRLQIDPLDHR